MPSKTKSEAQAPSNVPRVRNAFSPRIRQTARLDQEAGAHQSFKHACDINNIVAAHVGGAQVTHVNPSEPQYLDVLPQTFHDAMNIVTGVRSEFERLDAVTRSTYGNDPYNFLAERLANASGKASETPEETEGTPAAAAPEVSAPAGPTSPASGDSDAT